MRIYKPSFEIIDTPAEDYESKMLLDIELPARICYNSQDKICPGSARPFINGLINRGHLAPLEHGSVYMTLPLKTEFDYEAVQFYRENPYSKVKIDADKEEAYISTNYRVIIENRRGSDYVYRHPYIDNGNFERRVMVLFKLTIGTVRDFNRHRTHSICEESTRFCVSGDMLIDVNGKTVKVRDFYNMFTEKIGVGPFSTITTSEKDPGTLERCGVKGIFETGYKDCKSIITSDRSLVILTEDHQIMDGNKQFVKVSELSVGDKLYSKNIGTTTVMSIEDTPRVDCYEIEIDGNHNFFIGGLCVHNCNYSSEKYGSELNIVEPLMFRDGNNEKYNELSKSTDQASILRSYVADIADKGMAWVNENWGDQDYWFFVNLVAEMCYNGLTKQCNWTPQHARDCLCLGTYTRSYHTAFVSDWKHFFNLRAFNSKGNSPHPQAIELAGPLLEEFISRGYIDKTGLRQPVQG